MIQITASICDCCGLAVSSHGMEDCPRCGYPLDSTKEELFLQSAIHDLQRIVYHGGANVSIADLIQRYRARLNVVQQGLVEGKVATANVVMPDVSTTPTAQIQVQPGNAVTALHVPEPSLQVQAARRVLSWRSFFADQAINIIASLGAFFVLIGALKFVISTPSLLFSFLVLCIVHAVFGIASFITSRFPTFRIVTVIYSLIFALLVPLVAFSAYRLIIGSYSEFSMPLLIALSSIYAAAIYLVLALYQRFTPFAYLGFMALVIADLALASFLELAIWWWPATVMVLAFLALPSLQHPYTSNWAFAGRRAILRAPARIFMYAIIIANVCSLVFIVFTAFSFENYGFLLREIRFVILVMALLLLTWTSLSLWLTRRTRDAIVVALLFLITVLAGCYAFAIPSLGYIPALTCVAVLYHILGHFGSRLPQPSGTLTLRLDQLAVALVCIVPFISSPLLPIQLFASTNPIFAGDGTSIAAQSNVWMTTEFITIAIGFIVVLSIVFRHTADASPATKATWAWLLVINGFLLYWDYGIIILVFQSAPNWSFIGLSLATLACAMVVRQRWGEAWANPLDVVALCGILASLILNLRQSQDIMSVLLLSYAALLYGALLYQQRQRWIFLSLVCALFALLPLWDRPFVMLRIGAVLPLAAVVVHHRTAQARWTRPLLATGIVYAVMVSIHDMITSTSALPNIPGWHFPPALDLALLAITWYVCAALARKQLWLIPATIFAVEAVFMPGNTFWVLIGMVAGLTLLGVGISHQSGRNWALPFYTTALFAALATYIASTPQSSNEPLHGAIASMMVLYALIAFAVLVFEKQPRWIGLPMGLAAWSIGLWLSWYTASAMMAYSALCAIVFITQFVWNIRLPVSRRKHASVPHVILGLGGQAFVVLMIIYLERRTNIPGILAHTGAGALLELALLLAWYGYLYKHNAASLNAKAVQHWCYYIAGFMFSLVISWELLALQQTGTIILTLAPASALIVIAPLLMHDNTFPRAQQAGHFAALMGAFLLLAPALSLCFIDSNLVPTLVLLGESLALLLLGIVTRSRIYILSGTSLLTVGTLRMLFLASPPSLALMTLGGALLAVAMILFLVRHRLKVVWTEWK
jgi:hypothetical protein